MSTDAKTETETETETDTSGGNEQVDPAELLHDVDASAWPDAAGGEPVDGSEAEEAPAAPDATEFDVGGSTLPVDRDYDFEKAIPTDVPEYRESGRELSSIVLDIFRRHETGRMPRFLVTGPTACGKTLLGRHIAGNVLNCPLFYIQCFHGMKQSNLVGKVAYVEGETRWIDSVMPKALQASRQGPVLVIIDEVNRAPSKYKDLFFPFLDSRCQVEMTELGGELMKGNPQNLITIGTLNEGAGYTGTESIDLAELRRHANEQPTDYLGVENPAAEAELIADRTGVGNKLGMRLVTVANRIRDEARVAGSDVDMGLPTGTVLEWARIAHGKDGYQSDPVVKAAYDSFIEMFYSGDDAEREFVTSEVEDTLGGCPVSDEDVAAWERGEHDAGGDYRTLRCPTCEFSGQADEVEPHVLSFMECPRCGGTLKVA